MHHAFKYVFAALASLLLTGGLLASATTPAQAVETEPFVVIQANLGSGVDSDLSNDNYYRGHGSNEDPILAVSDKIANSVAHVATLQEICSEDVERMRVHLQNITGRTWYASRHYPMATADQGGSCTQGGRVPGSAKGNAILSRVPIYAGEDTISVLGWVDGRSNSLGCVNVAFGGSAANGARTQVCTTHLPAVKQVDGVDVNKTERLRQAKLIKNGIPAYTAPNGVVGVAHAGVDATQALVPYVLTGDFNQGLKTDVADLFHGINRAGTGLNTVGKFWEADHETGAANCSFGYCRDGEKTLDSDCCKYDMVFFGQQYGNGKASVNLTTLDSPTSNHKLVQAQSRFAY